MSCGVKICGLTNPGDAEAAVAAGADALGINLWPGSKRYLPLVESGWLEGFAGRVSRVAVVVGAPEDEVRRVWATGWFDWVQLHGEEPESLVHSLAAEGLPIIRALRVRDATVLETAWRWLERNVVVLLDAYHEAAPGGTGQAWDWSLAAKFSRQAQGRRWILSGGLNSENVSDACGIVQPPAVDVASGVERLGNPRHKDPSLLARFIQAAKGGAEACDTNPEIF